MPELLAFADRKKEGTFPVTDGDGVLVARIRVSGWAGTRFAAETAAGEPLCSGRTRGWFSRWWDVLDPGGAVLASMRGRGNRSRVVLTDGRELRVRGRAFFRNDWSLLDAQGSPLLASEPSGSGFWHPDAWAVRVLDESLGLALVIGVVQTNRLMVKSERAAATTAS